MRSSAVGVCVCVPTTTLTRARRGKAERLLLARRLGMEVDQNRVGSLLQAAGGQFRIDGAKRIIEFGHEDAAHGIDDEHVRAARALSSVAPLPGVPFG